MVECQVVAGKAAWQRLQRLDAPGAGELASAQVGAKGKVPHTVMERAQAVASRLQAPQVVTPSKNGPCVQIAQLIATLTCQLQMDGCSQSPGGWLLLTVLSMLLLMIYLCSEVLYSPTYKSHIHATSREGTHQLPVCSAGPRTHGGHIGHINSDSPCRGSQRDLIAHGGRGP